MAQLLKKFLCLGLLTCLSMTQELFSDSIIIPRSQSVNAARELVGWQRFINLADQDCTYGAFTILAEYQQSMRGARLMKCLFDGDVFLNNTTSTTTSGSCDTGCGSSNNCNSTASILVQGSCATDGDGAAITRNANAWLADYFGLPTDFNGVVNFKPKIRSGIIDFNLYLGLDEWAQGLFFRIHAPLVWTRWNLCASEVITQEGTNNFAAGYMSSAAVVNTTDLRHSFLSAIDGTYTFGDMTNTLKFGRYCGGTSTTTNGNCCGTNNNCGGSQLTRLSDVEMALGYNFLLCEDYHFGLEVRGSAPTGNKPCGVCLFEPIVGNGKYWTVGGGLTAHAVLWRDCECPDRNLSFYIDANVTTLLKSCQVRSFDLSGKPNSRYMLVEKFQAPYVTNTDISLYSGAAFGTATLVTAGQYVGANGLFPLINLSTATVNSSFGAQGDVALKFSYMTPNWDIDLGYEFWGRSREKLCVRSDFWSENTYVLKGDAFIYGFGATDGDGNLANAIVPMSASESLATIHAGTNGDICTAVNTANPSVDNAALAFGGVSGAGPTAATDGLIVAPETTFANGRQTRTSSTPVFIKESDFAIGDCNGNSTITHKVFGGITYNWDGCDCVSPLIGVGFEAEFAQCGGNNGSCGTSGDCCGTTTSCGSNSNCAISQWGVWLKGGFGF